MNIKQDILQAYGKAIINLQQYRTLIGLCNNNDEAGAKKGLAKLIRRQKRR